MGTGRSAKAYLCPACNQTIAPGAAHVVAWRGRAEHRFVAGCRRAPPLPHPLLGQVAVTALFALPPRLRDAPRFLHGLLGQGKNWATIAKGLGDRVPSVLLDLPQPRP